jgi:hypothetical protein
MSENASGNGNEDFDLAELLTLAQIAKMLPRRGRKKPVATSTVWRWCLGGPPKLRTVVVGGVRMSCERWLREFIAAKTAAAEGELAPTRTPRQRSRAVAAAEKALTEAGL